MAKKMKDLFAALFPLVGKKSRYYSDFRKYLQKQQTREVKSLLKQNKVAVYYNSIKTSFAAQESYPQLNQLVENANISAFIKDINNLVSEKAHEKCFKGFDPKQILGLIAPHILGYEEVKRACYLQLFSKERVHILIIGDPGTGKTDVLRAAESLSPIASFGLGSGTSGVGLAATKKGSETILGILPRADNGICCIDELNLMEKKDRGALLNAMEKGFITYDKGSSHMRLKARVRILATANPKGDRWIGRTIEAWKDQLPFDEALLSRFHLVFKVVQPNKEEFLKITKRILLDDKMKVRPEDVQFAKKYIDYALGLEVDFSHEHSGLVTNFMNKLKDDESKFIYELSPRLVHGIMNLAKASARSELRKEVQQEDVLLAMRLVKKALYVSLE